MTELLGCNSRRKMSSGNSNSTSPNGTTLNSSATAVNGGGDNSATMSRKFSPLAKTLRKNTLRAKEMMLNKLNKHHDRTADEMFDDFAVQIQRQHVVASRFSKELKSYASCVKALANASKMLNIVMRDEAFETAWHGAPQFVATTHANEAIWNDYCDLLNSQILPTTQLYLDQFAAIQARIAKRNRKLVDYDGARHELAAAEAAKKRDEQKILKAEEFLAQTKFTFENLNDELRRHMPRVRDSRVLFYAKTMHDLADIEQKFHAKSAASQQRNVPVLEKLVEEAEAGLYKSEWRSEAARTQQRTATFQNNFHKRQQQSANAVAVSNISGPRVVMMESNDMQMSAPTSSVPSTGSVSDNSAAAVSAEKHAVLGRNDDDEPDNNNNVSGEYDGYDSSADSDVSHNDNDKRRQSSSSGKATTASRSRSSGGGGFSGAASRMRNAIVAKASGLMNNNNNSAANSSSNNTSKRDSGMEDEHDNIGGGNGGLFPEGAVDAEDVDPGVEFKGIRRLDDDGVPTRDNNSAATPTESSASSRIISSRASGSGASRPPLPPAPVHLRQQQYHQRQRSSSSSASSAVQATSLVMNSTESVTSPVGGDKNSEIPPAGGNVSRVMLRQTNSSNSSAVASPVKSPVNASTPTNNSSETDVVLGSNNQPNTTNNDLPLDKLLKNRKLLYRARATHAYKGEDLDELSFSAGEMIYVLEYENPDDQDVGWQMGVRATTGDIGVFPENFTRVVMNE